MEDLNMMNTLVYVLIVHPIMFRTIELIGIIIVSVMNVINANIDGMQHGKMVNFDKSSYILY